MSRHEKEKSPQNDRGWTKARKLNAPISLEDLMVKELPLSLDDGDMRKISVRTDLTNEDLTHVKQRNRILDHPKTFRGSTYKDCDWPGFNWKRNHNGNKPVPFHTNLPQWGSTT